MTMLIQKPTPIHKGPVVDNGWKTCEPKTLRYVLENGRKGEIPFPGWGAILILTMEQNVVVRREGDAAMFFQVPALAALEFWGVA